MKNKVVAAMLGGNKIREPIDLLGGTFYIKLLSVYEAILCDISHRKLKEKLLGEGADKNLTDSITENASLVSMCLYDENDKLVFLDAFSAITVLTPEELLKVSRKYEKMQKQFLSLDNISSLELCELKKN